MATQYQLIEEYLSAAEEGDDYAAQRVLRTISQRWTPLPVYQSVCDDMAEIDRAIRAGHEDTSKRAIYMALRDALSAGLSK